MFSDIDPAHQIQQIRLGGPVLNQLVPGVADGHPALGFAGEICDRQIGQ